MRIECPGCEAAYEVPEAQIRPGRSVRCVRCAVQWRPAGEPAETQAAAAAPEDLAAEAAPRDEPVRDGVVRLRQLAAPAPLVPSDTAFVDDAPPAPPDNAAALQDRAGRVPAGWVAGWAASVILLCLLLGAASYWRRAVMQEWPPSIRLYMALGAGPPQG